MCGCSSASYGPTRPSAWRVSARRWRSRAATLPGHYVALLPTLPARRDPEARTVVFQTVSTVYLDAERYAELRRIVDAADVAWISTRRFSEEETGLEGGFELETGTRLVARMGYHGQWLEWRGGLPPPAIPGYGSCGAPRCGGARRGGGAACGRA